MRENEQRLDELEIKVSYQDDLVQELNVIVSQQQKKIDQLEASINSLNERIRELAMSAPADPPLEEKPPHY